MATVSTQRGRKGIFMKGQLKLSAYMNYGLVTVHVMQGRHLTSTAQRQPDTFVMISLIPEDADTTPIRCRTDIVKATSFPTFNEKFSFEVGEDDLHRRLLITVWSRDVITGGIDSFGCMSFGVRHLQRGDRSVNGWYHLLVEDVGTRKHLRVASKDRPAVPVMQSREPRGVVSGPAPMEIPSVNQNIPGQEGRYQKVVYRSPYGGFGFTVIDGCPVKIGRVDGASRAEEAGLLVGDLVIRVNGQNVSRSTSVSVARLIKRSGDMVTLEVHRPHRITLPTFMLGTTPMVQGGYSDDSEEGCNSIQDFTLYDDRESLLNNNISVDTRREAGLHRLLCLEENFVELMTTGIQKYSRPLRHCIVTGTQHASLFQNIEKLVCMSQYLMRQIIDNLPNHDDDDDSDTSFNGEPDLTSVVSMIYFSKLPVLRQAYTMYASGLRHASMVLSALETRADFRHFLLGDRSQGKQLTLCEFLNRPLQHVQEVCGVLTMIRDTIFPPSREHAAFNNIVKGLQSVLSSVRSATPVTSSLLSDSHLVAPLTASTLGSSSAILRSAQSSLAGSVQSIPSTLTNASSLRRNVPMMGSRLLKKTSSLASSSSGFGSGSSQRSDTRSQCSSESLAFHSEVSLYRSDVDMETTFVLETTV